MGSKLQKNLASVNASCTRPTMSRVLKTAFDILIHGCLKTHGAKPLEGLRTLDVFAGSGAFGFEALSRGSKAAAFIEKDPFNCKRIESIIQNQNLQEKATLYPCDINDIPIIDTPFDILFLDPPYGLELMKTTLPYLYEKKWLHTKSWIICETEIKKDLGLPSIFTIKRIQKIRGTQLSFVQLFDV